MNFPAPEIFKAYDIRGIVGKTLTPAAVRSIGQALGSEAVARGQRTLAVGRDGRLSGPELAQALAQGLNAAGVGVRMALASAALRDRARDLAERSRYLELGSLPGFQRIFMRRIGFD